MARPKTSDRSKAIEWSKKLPQELRTQGDQLFCLLCEKNVSCKKTYQVENHLATNHHAAKKARIDQSSESENEDTLEIAKEVTKAFLAADIPIYKLNNQSLKSLFTKIGSKLPSESACRRKVSDIANSERERVKEILRNSKIFMIVDESDIKRKKVFLKR